MKITKNSNFSSSFLIPQIIQPKNTLLYNFSLNKCKINEKMVYFPKRKLLSKSQTNDSNKIKQTKNKEIKNHIPISLYYHHKNEHFFTPQLQKKINHCNSVKENKIFTKKICETKNKNPNISINIKSNNEEEKNNIFDNYDDESKEINTSNLDDYIINDLNKNDDDDNQNVIIEDINDIDYNNNNDDETDIKNELYSLPENVKYGIDCYDNSIDIKEYFSNNENKNKLIGHISENKDNIKKNILKDLNGDIINKINNESYQNNNTNLVIKDFDIQNPQLKIYGYCDSNNKNKENLMEIWKQKNEKYENLYVNNTIQINNKINNKYNDKKQKKKFGNNNVINRTNIILNQPKLQLLPKPVLEINNEYNNFNINENLNTNLIKFINKDPFMGKIDKPKEKNVKSLMNNKNKSFMKSNHKNPLIDKNRKFIDLKTKINPEFKVVECDLSNNSDANDIKQNNNTFNNPKNKNKKNNIIKNLKTENILNNNYIKLKPTITNCILNTQQNNIIKNYSQKNLNNDIRKNKNYLYNNSNFNFSNINNISISKTEPSGISQYLTDRQNYCRIKTNFNSNSIMNISTNSSYSKYNTINNKYIVNNSCGRW